MGFMAASNDLTLVVSSVVTQELAAATGNKWTTSFVRSTVICSQLARPRSQPTDGPATENAELENAGPDEYGKHCRESWWRSTT